MNIRILENEYNTAIKTIIEKAKEFTNINIFNEEVKSLENEYREKKKNANQSIMYFVNNYEEEKIIHIERLKRNPLFLEINNELNIYKEGDIFNYIDNIEGYLEENLYVKDIELIIAINMYSTFKSIKNISKKKYPLIHNIIEKEKYSIELKLICPFCEEETTKSFYSKKIPTSLEKKLESISQCKCEFTSTNKGYLLNAKIMNKLLNKSSDVPEFKFYDNALNNIRLFVEKEFPDLFNFPENYIDFYDEEKQYINNKPIDKKIWEKIKNGNHDLNYYELASLKKLPNALIRGIRVCNLEELIKNIELNIHLTCEPYPAIDSESYKGFIEIPSKMIIDKDKISESFINFIKNYQSKKTLIKNDSTDDILALGHFCKSNNLLMQDLCEFVSLSEICKNYNIEFNEIKELIVRNS